MIPATQPLRDEYGALLPELGALRAAADAVGSSAAAEEFDRARLYPTINRLVGNDATAAMRRDHEEIRERMCALDGLRSSNEPDVGSEGEVRAALYGLDAIVRLHLAKEEELYYPLLDAQLSEEEVTELITAVHEVERNLYHQATGTPAARRAGTAVTAAPTACTVRARARSGGWADVDAGAETVAFDAGWSAQPLVLRVVARRPASPPRFVAITSVPRLVADDPENRVELHRNLCKFGTVSNTLAAARTIDGRVVATPSGAQP